MVIRRNLQKQRKSTDFAQNPKHLYWILWKYLPQTIPDMPYHELNKWKIHYINYWAASSYVRNRLSWLNLIHFWLFSRILFCSAEKFREWVVSSAKILLLFNILSWSWKTSGFHHEKFFFLSFSVLLWKQMKKFNVL